MILGCTHPTIQGMIMNRHHTAVSLCGRAISKGSLGSSIIAVDACAGDKLLEQVRKSQRIVQELSPIGSFPMAPAPPDTKATPTPSLLDLSLVEPPMLIQKKNTSQIQGYPPKILP